MGTVRPSPGLSTDVDSVCRVRTTASCTDHGFLSQVGNACNQGLLPYRDPLPRLANCSLLPAVENITWVSRLLHLQWSALPTHVCCFFIPVTSIRSSPKLCRPWHPPKSLSCSCDQNTWQKQFKGGKICIGAWFQKISAYGNSRVWWRHVTSQRTRKQHKLAAEVKLSMPTASELLLLARPLFLKVPQHPEHERVEAISESNPNKPVSYMGVYCF